MQKDGTGLSILILSRLIYSILHLKMVSIEIENAGQVRLNQWWQISGYELLVGTFKFRPTNFFVFSKEDWNRFFVINKIGYILEARFLRNLLRPQLCSIQGRTQSIVVVWGLQIIYYILMIISTLFYFIVFSCNGGGPWTKRSTESMTFHGPYIWPDDRIQRLNFIALFCYRFLSWLPTAVYINRRVVSVNNKGISIFNYP